MKKYALKILSLLLVIATLSLMVSCDLGSVLGDIAPDDLGNGQENGASGEIKFTLEATEPSKDNDNENENNNDNEENTEEETEAETEKEPPEHGEPTFTPSISQGDIDFDGMEISILYRDHIQNSREWYKASPEDDLDEAIAMRNEAVEETLNLKIMFEPVASNGRDYGEYSARFYNMVMNDVDTGMQCFDVSANYGYATASMAIRDYTTNLLDEALFPYFDFSLPCWNQSIVENTTFNDRLLYVAGDVNLSIFDAAYVVWHNKTLYDEKKEITDPENMQDLALAGQWTYDELYRWSQRLYENSNGQEGKQENDTFGLIIEEKTNNGPNAFDAIPYAWDLEFISTNIYGLHSFSISGNEKLERALVKCRDLLSLYGTAKNSNTIHFAQGHSMFYMGLLYADYESNMTIREMEDKYGLLPMPKYDADQKNYCTTSQEYYTLMFVLDHSMSSFGIKGEAISAALQCMNEISHTNVREYYFNRIIKPKFFGKDDSEGTVTKSIALFDVIVSNIKFDMYNIYSAQLNNINLLWRQALKGDESLEMMYNSQKNIFDVAIKDTDKWLGLK